MIKHTRQKFLVALKGIVLCVSLSVPQINHTGWAQSPDAEVKTLDAEVNAYIQQLKDRDVTVRVTAASALGRPILGNPNFANPSGSAAVAVSALTKALKDQEATVRVSAAVALGKRSYIPTTREDVEILANLAIPELIKTLKDDKEVAGVRSRAANSIGEISWAINKITKKSLREFFGNEETINDLVDTLIIALKHRNVQVRASAAYALETMGSDASAAVPTLVNLLKEKKQDIVVRAKAANSLGNADLKASLNGKAVPALISALKEQKPEAYLLRANAALALGSMGSEPIVAKDAVQPLIIALKDKNTLVRSSAANALGLMGSNAKDAISKLIEVEKEEKNQNVQFRTDVINALGKIASDPKVAGSKRIVSVLISILKDGNDETYVRQSAAYALGKVGLESEETVRALIEVVEDSLEDRQVRKYAAYSLQEFFKNQAYQDPTKNKDKSLSFGGWKQLLIIRNGQNAAKVLEKSNEKEKLFLEEEKEVKWYLQILNRQLQFLIFDWIQKNPLILVLMLYFLVLPSVWIFIFLLNPLGVFYIKQAFNRFKGIDLPYPLSGGFKGTIDILTFISFLDFFCYRPRVFDKWISNQYKLFNKNFLALVKKYDDYEPIAVELDGTSVTKLTIKELQPIFSKKLTRLVIQGEGGTKLAYQLAKWAMSKDKNERLCKHLMLPVLITDFELNSENKADDKLFINAISGQLRDLVEATDSILPELLDQLLRQRRVLVIVNVDGFSEMSDAKTLEIKNRLSEPAFPVNALVLTSQTKLEMKGRLYSLCQIG
ncbi:hypothetical protein CDG76_22110 [Nostoc sp. 'Peltigera membranacea cyanobiont' 210A]|uniref:HEAT repeat domain-containing protein n=1 Tax=Nostoc sp. 'Peltigera membranacea cyanobiont' 210A TaxID=2014529 RepID=UPI000B951371|nr:HEAT repeat domain-containing protein [Nostoc sp. 'Peltigera membranacea cyanobiont' 210A]OYD93357.1 hypothetical protein CDG76_22110 [Nostoc sp. 'Peltigera membranacea cyanobiont' 210A]